MRARRRVDFGQGVEPRSLPPISVRIVEACKLTGICRSKLYELNKAGVLRFRKIGSATIVSYEELRTLVDCGAPDTNEIDLPSAPPVATVEQASSPCAPTTLRVLRPSKPAKDNPRQGSLFDMYHD
jgi:excisionase family DNA binding protein